MTTYIRQRSPPNAPLSANDLAWQTVRAQNADGTSTVYRVHESVGVNGMQYVAGGGAFGGGTGVLYGAPAPTNNVQGISMGVPPGYNSYGNNGETVIFIPNNDDDSETDSDDEEAAMVVATAPDAKPKKAPRCSKTTPCCIGSGVVLAVGFLVGYIFLIEFFVSNRPPPHQSHTSSMATAAPGGEALTNLRSVGAPPAPPQVPEAPRPQVPVYPQQMYVLTPVMVDSQKAFGLAPQGAAEGALNGALPPVERPRSNLSAASRDEPLPSKHRGSENLV